MSVKMVWRTDNAEKLVLQMARVSSNDQYSQDTRLLSYLIKHKHWSPLESVNMCLEINTSRDVSAQIIRHRSFTFQEFSQRYAQVQSIEKTNPRRQDTKNRQNSFDDLDEETSIWWSVMYNDLTNKIQQCYNQAIEKGISKESARRLLPMASSTKLYMNGTLRSWVHYFSLRCEIGVTQLEHCHIALEAKNIFIDNFPIISEALGYEKWHIDKHQ